MNANSADSKTNQGNSDFIRLANMANDKVSFFRRGIVIEVLNDVGKRTKEELEDIVAEPPEDLDSLSLNEFEIASKNLHKKLITDAPRNSLIIRPVSEGHAVEKQNVLCYPMLPPHICLPVKTGEYVWYFMDDAGGQAIKDKDQLYGYWVCRQTSHLEVDDLNYTHCDREFDTRGGDTGSTSDKAASQSDESSDDEEKPFKPQFIDGQPENPNSRNVQLEEGGYDELVKESISHKSFVPEPIPRFTKRPGDLVLQGSNNTLICLGQDRGWGTDDRPAADGDSNASDEISEKVRTGAIDIVTGRGRMYKDGTYDDDPVEATQCRVVDNSRGDLETDKNPALNDKAADKLNRRDRRTEGDPDFLYDSSRVYVSMASAVDEQFGIKAEKIPTAFETAPTDYIKDSEAACIVVKSDEIRIISRKKDDGTPTDSPEINGSIRIIKEGVKDDDAACIMILPDGTIQISGSKIFFGRTSDDGGKDKGAGPGKSEPYMRYSDFEKWAGSLMDKLETEFSTIYDTFDDIAMSCLTPVGSALAASLTPGFGGPDASNIAAGSQISSYAPTLSANVQGVKAQLGQNFSSPHGQGGSKTKKIKSERIFGE